MLIRKQHVIRVLKCLTTIFDDTATIFRVKNFQFILGHIICILKPLINGDNADLLAIVSSFYGQAIFRLFVSIVINKSWKKPYPVSSDALLPYKIFTNCVNQQTA